LGIVEIIVILAVALIVIPPEHLPDVMRATGKVLRELRLASNMVVRELGGALDLSTDNLPPINTMKPSANATGVNIAQSAAPADIARTAELAGATDVAQPADSKTSPDLASVATAPTAAATAPQASESVAAASSTTLGGPKATD
jgi:Sec-independent protein translocase protein TatA